LNADIEKQASKLSIAGKKLSKARLALIPDLNKAVVAELKDLGFKQSRFDASLKTIPIRSKTGQLQANSTGWTKLIFNSAPTRENPCALSN